MGLREIEPTLPPGFKFYPSDEELVCHYLYKKVANQKVSRGLTMVEVDLHTREPWELPEVAKLSENEWYFFSFRDRKYSTGSRANRATRSGYWKATGKDRTVRDPKTRSIVGMRKTLVFYTGRAPNGMKTCWVMHEFRLENPHMPSKEDWVLCRVVYKRKGETALSFSLDREMENIAAGCSSSQYLDSSHDFLIEELIMADGCHEKKKPMGPSPAFPIAHLEGGNNSSSPFNCSSLCLHQEVDSSTMKNMGVVSSRVDDDEIDYSFLLDVGLGEELGGLASVDDQLFF